VKEAVDLRDTSSISAQFRYGSAPSARGVRHAFDEAALDVVIDGARTVPTIPITSGGSCFWHGNCQVPPGHR